MTSNDGDLPDRSGDGDLPYLNVSEWDPPLKAKKKKTADGNDGGGCKSNTKDKTVDKRRNLTYEEILQSLEEKMKDLLQRTDYTSLEVRGLLKFIQLQTRYSSDVILNKRLTEKIVKLGIAHVFLRAWNSINKVEYLLNDHVLAFKNLQTTLSIIWNCTDKSASLCDTVSRCGLIQLFLGELESEKLNKSDLSNDTHLYLVKAYLGILHNIIRMCSDSRRLFRSANAVTILQSYLHRPVSLVKTKAYLILAYIINEQENDLINATDENIKFFLDILDDALESENHFSKTHAFWAVEIICGLNHLSVSDVNKVRMGRLGAFPLYLKLLQSENVDEQNLGAAGLWILSFNEENKVILRELPECMQALQSLATTSTNGGIRRAARGALWVVRTSAPSSSISTPERRVSQVPTPETEDVNAPHVMISYHWSAQETMIKIKDRLKAAGFKIWMDVDNMTGSTLEAMALAVERSVVVLICMSQDFKDSPSCRTEAEYIYRLHKDVIPLLLQPDYDPDGWLGLLVGTKLHFDFSTKENVGTQLPRLIKELGNRGRLPLRQRSQPSASYESLDVLHSSASVSSLHSYVMKSARVLTWDRDDVNCWLEDLGMEQLAQKLSDLDGPLLLQYKKMMDNAPQYFYHTLEDILRLNLVSTLQFTKALDTLK